MTTNVMTAKERDALRETVRLRARVAKADADKRGDIQFLRGEARDGAAAFIGALKIVIDRLPNQTRPVVLAALQDEFGADLWVCMRMRLTESVDGALDLFEFELEDEVAD